MGLGLGLKIVISTSTEKSLSRLFPFLFSKKGRANITKEMKNGPKFEKLGKLKVYQRINVRPETSPGV